MELRESAKRLAALFRERGIEAMLTPSQGQVGGGALPGVPLPGWGVVLTLSRSARGSITPNSLAKGLLRGDPPVLAVLREGKLVFDVRTLEDSELPLVVGALARLCAGRMSPRLGANQR